MLTTKEAADLYGLTQYKFRKWDQLGWLVPEKTPGGHRRYTKKQIDEFLGLTTPDPAAMTVDDIADWLNGLTSHQDQKSWSR